MRDAGTGRLARQRLLLLATAGLGGLLYGIDIGIIAGALPYLEATFRDAATGRTLDAGQLSTVVASVLLGSVLSTLFAGLLADRLGRRRVMVLAGLLFAASIPLIALARAFGPLVAGRLLQGVSAGLVGVAVPLYLAESLPASSRGRGTAVFQWLLTAGIVVAAVVGWLFSLRVEEVAALHDPRLLEALKDRAWRGIFWVSLPPGLLFVLGALLAPESPRWLFRRGRVEAARGALRRTRPDGEAEAEMEEMAQSRSDEGGGTGEIARAPLLSRRYVVPFLLACLVLACTQATGINSIIGYNATILIQAGLDDRQAHLGYVALTLVNFLVTIAGVALVDRRGRKFLLTIGSGGIAVTLVGVALLFRAGESGRVDCREAVQAMVTEGAAGPVLALRFDPAQAERLVAGAGGRGLAGRPATLTVIYSAGDFVGASRTLRSDEPAASLELTRAGVLPSSGVEAFFRNPFADLARARTAPLRVEHAFVAPVPDGRHGLLVAVLLCVLVAFYAAGPGVCVWLALSELMPTRIRSNGMSVALLVNQAVSTTIAAFFLPAVGRYGYSTIFFLFAGCTVVYFLAAAFLLPETKGRTLEEIEEHFAGASAEGRGEAR